VAAASPTRSGSSEGKYGVGMAGTERTVDKLLAVQAVEVVGDTRSVDEAGTAASEFKISVMLASLFALRLATFS